MKSYRQCLLREEESVFFRATPLTVFHFSMVSPKESLYWQHDWTQYKYCIHIYADICTYIRSRQRSHKFKRGDRNRGGIGGEKCYINVVFMYELMF